MPALKHTHQYVRMRENKDTYLCAHPDCSHYQKRELLVGKRSTCICGEEFILNYKALTLKRPHCENCGAAGKRKQDIKTIIEQILEPEIPSIKDKPEEIRASQINDFLFPEN